MRGVTVQKMRTAVARGSRVAVLAYLLLHASSPAFAQDAPANPDAAEEEIDFDAPVPADRRSDFTFGANLGVQFGSASGFPEDFDKVGVSEHEVDTGVVASFGANGWIGGALQDWFTFGLGGGAVSLSGNGLDASGGAFLVHIEVFPLFELGGALRDLGVMANFGVGGASIERDGKERAQGAGLSVVGTGLFWEALRWGGWVLGPSGEYLYMSTRNITIHAGQVGLRFAWYSGP